MNRPAKMILTLLAGFAVGAGAIEALHAQGKAPAYLVAEIEVTDPPAYQAYLKKAVDSLKPYSAHIVARGKPDVVEGMAAQGNVLVVEFASMADAKKWYTTPPYKDLVAQRQKAAKSRLYFIEGVSQ